MGRSQDGVGLMWGRCRVGPGSVGVFRVVGPGLSWGSFQGRSGVGFGGEFGVRCGVEPGADLGSAWVDPGLVWRSGAGLGFGLLLWDREPSVPRADRPQVRAAHLRRAMTRAIVPRSGSFAIVGMRGCAWWCMGVWVVALTVFLPSSPLVPHGFIRCRSAVVILPRLVLLSLFGVPPSTTSPSSSLPFSSLPFPALPSPSSSSSARRKVRFRGIGAPRSNQAACVFSRCALSRSILRYDGHRGSHRRYAIVVRRRPHSGCNCDRRARPPGSGLQVARARAVRLVIWARPSRETQLQHKLSDSIVGIKQAAHRAPTLGGEARRPTASRCAAQRRRSMSRLGRACPRCEAFDLVRALALMRRGVPHLVRQGVVLQAVLHAAAFSEAQ